MYRKISQEDLQEMLEQHKLWLKTRFVEKPQGARANLGMADLREADLREADLREADLREADLRGANLREANLGMADLIEADLIDVHYDETTSFYALQCPEEGSFIAYKKAENKIVKLKIPADAKRSSATTRKCRASKAEVLAIENLDGSDSGMRQVSSKYDSDFIYTIGKTVTVDDYEECRWIEDAPGIHFYITRNEVVQYG